MATTIAAVTLMSCSSGDGAPRPGNAAQIAADVASLAITDSMVWGHGRARLAAPVDTGVAVATTTGLVIAGDAVDRLLDLGPDQRIDALATSPDGSRVAMAYGPPATIVVYDVDSGVLTPVPDPPPERPIAWLELLADGRILAGSSEGVSSATIDGGGGWSELAGRAGAAAALPDGRVVVPLAGTRSLLIADDDVTREQVLDLPPDHTVVDAVASPDGSVVAVTAASGGDPFERQDDIVVLDAATFQRLATVTTEQIVGQRMWALSDDVLLVAVDGRLRAFAHDGTARPISEPSLDAAIASIHTDGTRVVAADEDGAVVSWDVSDGAHSVLDDGGTVKRDVRLADGVVTVVDFFGRVTTWDLTDSRRHDDERFATGEATAVAVATDGRVGSATSSGEVGLLTVGTDLAGVWNVRPHGDGVRVDTVEFLPDGHMAIGLADRLSQLAFDDTVTVFDPASPPGAGNFEIRHGGESEEVAGCAFFYNRVRPNSDGTLLALTSHDFSVTVIDPRTGAEIAELPPLQSAVLDVTFSADDEHLLVSADDATVRVWATDDWELVGEFATPLGGITAMAALAGDRLVGIGIPGDVVIFDATTGEQLLAFEPGGVRTSNLTASADGRLVAAPGPEGAVSVWSTADGRLLASLVGHVGAVTDVALSPDGSRLASAGTDGTVRVWSLELTDS